MIAKWKIPTDEEFKNIVLNSKTMVEIMQKLGYEASSGAARKPVKERILSLGLKIPQLSNIEKVQKANSVNKLSDDIFFSVGKNRDGKSIRNRLIDGGYVENKCSICGLNPEWNGRPLTLQVDHINGIHTDNRIENLRLVCPNCHSQTDTFGGKNIKSLSENRKTNICEKCGKIICTSSKLCVECMHLSQRVVERPTKEQLLKEVLAYGWTGTGRIYNVSEAAIRKWCKNYGLPTKIKDIKEYQITESR